MDYLAATRFEDYRRRERRWPWAVVVVTLVGLIVYLSIALVTERHARQAAVADWAACDRVLAGEGERK